MKSQGTWCVVAKYLLGTPLPVTPDLVAVIDPRALF